MVGGRGSGDDPTKKRDIVPGICTDAGCEAQSRARGLCLKHYWKATDPTRQKTPAYLAAKAARERSPEYRAKKSARRRRRTVDARRHEYLRREYGLTPAQVDAMALEQSGVCAICGKLPSKRLVVDHCHTSGRVRGLLCHTCNVSIGGFSDNPSVLRRAAEYLEKAR